MSSLSTSRTQPILLSYVFCTIVAKKPSQVIAEILSKKKKKIFLHIHIIVITGARNKKKLLFKP